MNKTSERLTHFLLGDELLLNSYVGEKGIKNKFFATIVAFLITCIEVFCTVWILTLWLKKRVSEQYPKQSLIVESNFLAFGVTIYYKHSFLE